MLVSGYPAPETQLFANRRLIGTFFASMSVDNHQNNALAVANNEAGRGYQQHGRPGAFCAAFSDQYGRLRVLWTSSMIPHAVVVIRTDLPADCASASRHRGHLAGGERNANTLLQLIHDISGFAPRRQRSTGAVCRYRRAAHSAHSRATPPCKRACTRSTPSIEALVRRLMAPNTPYLFTMPA